MTPLTSLMLSTRTTIGYSADVCMGSLVAHRSVRIGAPVDRQWTLGDAYGPAVVLRLGRAGGRRRGLGHRREHLARARALRPGAHGGVASQGDHEEHGEAGDEDDDVTDAGFHHDLG